MGRVSIELLTAGDVEELLAWRYPGDYGRYDLTPEDRPKMTDPASTYWAIKDAGALIGFICVGAEARVPGMLEDRSFMDIGVGLRPDLTGQGNSRVLLPQVLDAVALSLKPAVLRAVVASWNQRAQRATESAGFRKVGIHENDNGTYLVYLREL